MNQKAYLERKNNHKNNEKLLFHGTSSDNIDKINDRGFNRSFAGMHGRAEELEWNYVKVFISRIAFKDNFTVHLGM